MVIRLTKRQNFLFIAFIFLKGDNKMTTNAKEKRKFFSKNKKIIIVSLCCCIVLVLCGYTYNHYQAEQTNEKNLIAAKHEIASLFQDKKQTLPIADVNNTALNKADKKVKKVADKKLQKKLNEKLKSVQEFVKTRELLRSYFDQDVLKVETTQEQLKQAEEKLNKLMDSYRPLLLPVYELANNQYQAINNAKNSVRLLFDDDALSAVSENIGRNEYQTTLDILNALPQKQILEQYQPNLDNVNAVLTQREEEEARRIEAERQAAIQRAREEAQRLAEENARLQAANVVLNGIPYYNQKAAGLPNGCECASLLMALHYKGYASGIDLNTFADNCPRSTDPHQGFVFAMDSYNPTDRVHWIAPDALTVYGSQYGNVVNISGCSAADLKAEIDAGNPVVFYSTYGFAAAKPYDGEVPGNLHVMTLIGYNPLSNTYIVNDPVSGQLNVSAANFERAFSYTRYAVVVR